MVSIFGLSLLSPARSLTQPSNSVIVSKFSSLIVKPLSKIPANIFPVLHVCKPVVFKPFVFKPLMFKPFVFKPVVFNPFVSKPLVMPDLSKPFVFAFVVTLEM